MEGRSAVFVDLASLNVVFKLGDKFTCALNYKSGLEHLSKVMPTLGTGYDIYLNIVPRTRGDGDLVIHELSSGGLPFTVSSLELYKVLEYFRASSGVSEVYLCNGLQNYIACSKVQSFESVFFHGNKVIYIRVKDRMLEEYRIFTNQLEFSNEFGQNYAGYGDIDLVDVNRVIAQYPELSTVSKAQIACIAPLIQCYHGPDKMPTAELYGRLLGKYKDGNSLPTEDITDKEDRGAKVVDPNIIPSKEIPEPPIEHVSIVSKRKRAHEKTPVLAKLFVGVSCILAFTIGVFVRTNVDKTGSSISEQYFIETDQKISLMKSLTSVYSSAATSTTDAREKYEYLLNSDLAVTIIGYTYNLSGSEVRCACASAELSDSFKEYIENRYTVLSTNDLGEAWSESGTVYQFSVLFQ